MKNNRCEVCKEPAVDNQRLCSDCLNAFYSEDIALIRCKNHSDLCACGVSDLNLTTSCKKGAPILLVYLDIRYARINLKITRLLEVMK